jgi:hypothetical protein
VTHIWSYQCGLGLKRTNKKGKKQTGMFVTATREILEIWKLGLFRIKKKD